MKKRYRIREGSTYLAIDNNLEIIPVINKIDLPSADPDKVRKEIEDVIGIDASEAVLCSAKTGEGVDDILEAIVERIPAPECDDNKPLKALVFDSKFDSYKGVILYLRVYDGTIRKGMKIEMMATGATYEVTEVGVFKPAPVNVDETTARCTDDDAYLSPLMTRVEVDQVNNAHHLAFSIVNHQAQLTVGINVAAGVGNVVTEHVAGIRHIGGTDTPEHIVVLNAIKHVKVFGFQSPEADWGQLFHL